MNTKNTNESLDIMIVRDGLIISMPKMGLREKLRLCLAIFLNQKMHFLGKVLIGGKK